MICCKGRYCLALVITVFSWLFHLCTKYFVLRIYFHINCNHCVTCMLYWVARFFTLPTRVLRFGTRPPKRPDGDIHSAEPPLFSASGSILTGWRPRGLTVYLDGLFNNTIYIYIYIYIYIHTHTYFRYTHARAHAHSVETAEISMGKFDNPTSGHDFPRQSNKWSTFKCYNPRRIP